MTPRSALQAADTELQQAERLVTLASAARRYGVTDRTIRRWIASGKVQTRRCPSGRRRVVMAMEAA